MTMTEMKEQREKMKREAELLKQMEIEAERQRLEAQQKLLQDRGCGWGIGLLCYDIFKKKKRVTFVTLQNGRLLPVHCLHNRVLSVQIQGVWSF